MSKGFVSAFFAVGAALGALVSALPPTFAYQRKAGKKVKTIVGPAIERDVPLDEKLTQVLPQAHSISSPAGTALWQDFVELKSVRDRLIHLKSVDRRASGAEDQTVWGLMLEKHSHAFANIACSLIGAFEPLVTDRRWFQRAV